MALNSSDSQSSLDISNCSFQHNQALYGSGGAMFVSGVSSFNVDTSNFTNCSAAVAGGSIFASAVATVEVAAESCSIQSSNFFGSLVGVLPTGGWPATANSALGPTKTSTQLQLHGGGAVFLSSFGVVNFENCTFNACSSVRSKGGGLRIRACVRALIKATSFTGCQAATAGALSISSMLQLPGVLVGLLGTTFTNNTASMQLDCPQLACVELDTTLVGAQGDGGAIGIDGSSLLLFNINTFTSNSATGRGGAVFAQRPSGGGLLHFDGDSHRIGDNTAEQSTLTALAAFPQYLHTSFVNNSALVAGGALAIRGYILSSGTSQSEAGPVYTLFYGNVSPTGEPVIKADWL